MSSKNNTPNIPKGGGITKFFTVIPRSTPASTNKNNPTATDPSSASSISPIKNHPIKSITQSASHSEHNDAKPVPSDDNSIVKVESIASPVKNKIPPVVESDSEEDAVIPRKPSIYSRKPSTAATPPPAAPAPQVKRPRLSKYDQEEESTSEYASDGEESSSESSDDDDFDSESDDARHTTPKKQGKKQGTSAASASGRNKTASTPASPYVPKTSRNMTNVTVSSANLNEFVLVDDGSETTEATASLSSVMADTDGVLAHLPLNSDDEDEDDDGADASSSEKQPKSSVTMSASTTAAAQAVSKDLGHLVGDYKLPDFVLPKHIKDANMRRPNDPDYDPRTLYIPPHAFKDMTPAQKQFWEMKQSNMDVVLCFKVGKFYELFDLDAEIGIRELNLVRMGASERLHAGFPEMAYNKYASQLVAKGYKVARAEQTQTPKQLAEANKTLAKGQKKSSVVTREICEILTPGTVVQEDFINSDHSTYVLAITEFPLTPAAVAPSASPQTDGVGTSSTAKDASGDESTAPTYIRVEYSPRATVIGVCFVDTSTGAFQLGSFIDDTNQTILRTLLAEIRPVELVLYRGAISAAVEQAIRMEAPVNLQWTWLNYKTEYHDAQRSLTLVEKAQYFDEVRQLIIKRQSSAVKTEDVKEEQIKHEQSTNTSAFTSIKARTQQRIPPNVDLATGWPLLLHRYKAQLQQIPSTVGEKITKTYPTLFTSSQSASKQHPSFTVEETESIRIYQLWTAYGAIVYYFRRLLLDKQLIPLCNITEFVPNLPSLQPSPTAHSTSSLQTTSTSTGPTTTTTPTTITAPSAEFDHLILDAQTLSNLEVLVNNHDGTVEGTLFQHIDYCHTPFGRRLLRHWLARPLGRIDMINQRLDCVEELMQAYDTVEQVQGLFKKLPDLERLLSRIRANGMKSDITAVMFENVTKGQVELFIKVLKGFQQAIDAINLLTCHQPEFKTKLLRLLTNQEQQQQPQEKTSASDAANNDSSYDAPGLTRGGQHVIDYPTIIQLLHEFTIAFDHKQALRDGYIVPQPGVVTEYDDAVEHIKETEGELQLYLREQMKLFGGDARITYFHRAKETYQLEIPIAVIDRNKSKVDHTYEQASSTKAVRRFYTPRLRELVRQLDDAKELKEALLLDVTRQVFAKFSDDFLLWSSMVQNIAHLDCLMALATVSRVQEADFESFTSSPNLPPEVAASRRHNGLSCRPIFIPLSANNNQPLLEIRDSVHPAIAGASSRKQKKASKARQASSANDHDMADDPSDLSSGTTTASSSSSFQDHGRFISNDVDLGSAINPSHFVLLSGPNMGGKSTILRQTCCAVILAQLGCFVPAAYCRLTPVDRIFTRVGANDRIMHGESTFLVELNETSIILRHATHNSLVILDELGRGTSTFDGTAIAYSVIKYLCDNIKCMTLFSTHYHMLLEEFKNDPRVSMYHMACQVRAPDGTLTDSSVNTSVTMQDDSSASSSTTPLSSSQQSHDIVFLYKFIQGTCHKSFGLHVASLANLPESIINRAHDMSELFEGKLELAHNVGGALRAATTTSSVTSTMNDNAQQSTSPHTLLKRTLLAMASNDTKQLQLLAHQYRQLVQNA